MLHETWNVRTQKCCKYPWNGSFQLQNGANSREGGHNRKSKKHEREKSFPKQVWTFPLLRMSSKIIPCVCVSYLRMLDVKNATAPDTALWGGLVVHPGGRSTHGGLEGLLQNAPNFAASKQFCSVFETGFRFLCGLFSRQFHQIFMMRMETRNLDDCCFWTCFN